MPAKLLALSPKGYLASPPNKEKRHVSNHKLLFMLFNGCLTLLLEPLFNRSLDYINKEIPNQA